MPSNKRYLIAVTDLDSGEQQSGYYENFLLVGGSIDHAGNDEGKMSHLISIEDDETLELLRNHANYIVDEGHRRNAMKEIGSSIRSMFDVEGMTQFLQSLVDDGKIDLNQLNVTPDCDCIRCQALVKLKGAN